MELTPRLQAIAAQVPEGARLADVGTDHGYLPVCLVLEGRVDQAIATDLRDGPLGRARETAAKFGVLERLSFRLCDGLTGIGAEETDVIAIAGMGGETIASIIEAAPWTKRGKLLLVQPMTAFPQLRAWLQKNGYVIERETIACEGKRFYPILSVRGGSMMPLTPAELWAGRQSDDPFRVDYLDMMIEKVRRILRGHRSAYAIDGAAVAELETVQAGLRQMREELKL